MPHPEVIYRPPQEGMYLKADSYDERSVTISLCVIGGYLSIYLPLPAARDFASDLRALCDSIEGVGAKGTVDLDIAAKFMSGEI